MDGGGFKTIGSMDESKSSGKFCPYWGKFEYGRFSEELSPGLCRGQKAVMSTMDGVSLGQTSIYAASKGYKIREFIPVEEWPILNWDGGNGGSYVSREVTLKGLMPQGNPVLGSKAMMIGTYKCTEGRVDQQYLHGRGCTKDKYVDGRELG
jgi:hypothetical protein